MIAKIIGKLVETKEQSLIILVGGICYEVIVPVSVLARLDETKDVQNVHANFDIPDEELEKITQAS